MIIFKLIIPKNTKWIIMMLDLHLSEMTFFRYSNTYFLKYPGHSHKK